MKIEDFCLRIDKQDRFNCYPLFREKRVLTDSVGLAIVPKTIKCSIRNKANLPALSFDTIRPLILCKGKEVERIEDKNPTTAVYRLVRTKYHFNKSYVELFDSIYPDATMLYHENRLLWAYPKQGTVGAILQRLSVR